MHVIWDILNIIKGGWSGTAVADHDWKQADTPPAYLPTVFINSPSSYWYARYDIHQTLWHPIQLTYHLLTQSGLHEMINISQTTFPFVFSWLFFFSISIMISSKFVRRIQSTINQRSYRYLFGFCRVTTYFVDPESASLMILFGRIKSFMKIFV